MKNLEIAEMKYKLKLNKEKGTYPERREELWERGEEEEGRGERRGELKVREEEGVRKEEWDIVICWMNERGREEEEEVISNIEKEWSVNAKLVDSKILQTNKFHFGISFAHCLETLFSI